MSVHAAFLKGINLGRRRISNDELRAHFEALGLHQPAVLRASGNVIFSDPGRRGEDALAELIASGLERRLGYAVAAFLRTAPELLGIAAAEPFDGPTRARLTGKLQVVLLGEPPAKQAQARALALAGDDDALAFGRRELYWLPAGGMSESSLELRALERLLGPITIRTMGTIREIAARHLAR